MKAFRLALEEFSRLEQVIRDSGEVAPAGCWIDVYSPKGRSYQYARKRSDCRMWSGKKTKSLGRVGSEAHREFELAVKRRNEIDEITRRAIAIQEMLDNPIVIPGL